jgi:Family of unknown function (DUF6535)
LFSATVAALIVPSIADLFPTTSTTITIGPLGLFSSSTSIILANKYWLLSLLLSISCALVALSLPRWAQPPTGVTSPRYSLPEQIRLRTLFSAGIERLNFAFLVEALHCLVHIAFSLFLIGLSQYFFHVNSTIFQLAQIWIVLFFLIYAGLTVVPILRPGSPYSTPFSNSFAVACAIVLQGTYRLFYLVTSLIRGSKATPWAVRHPKDRFRDWHFLDLMKFAREKAREQAPQIDGGVLKRTLNMLRSDDDLEQFFETIPGFCASEVVDNPRRSLHILGQQRLAEALVEFFNRTLSSDRVSESVKGRRLIICMRVIEAADLSIAVPRILHLFSGDLHGVSRSVEIGHSLGVLRNSSVASLARGIITSIISINDDRDESWYKLAMDELNISKDVLRRYLDHGDSLLLANLIHTTRQFFDSLLQRDLDLTRKSLSILPSLSKFDVLNPLPELKRDFCALWNEIVEKARSSGADNNSFIGILVEIRSLYVTLHGTDAALTYFFASSASYDDLLRQPASYPLCTIPDHRCSSTTHIQEASGGTTSGTGHITTTSSPIPLSESSFGNVIATGVVPGMAATSLASSMFPPIARSPSGIGDALQPDKEITVSLTLLILPH